MKCNYCHKDVRVGEVYCMSCGKKIVQDKSNQKNSLTKGGIVEKGISKLKILLVSSLLLNAVFIGLMILQSEVFISSKRDKTSYVQGSTNSIQSSMETTTTTNEMSSSSSDENLLTGKAGKAESEMDTADKKAQMRQAISYLETCHMSADGLKSQITYEKISEPNQNEIVDVLNKYVDWNKLAVYKAKSYRESANLTGERLKDQLRYEEFTEAQVNYGVEHIDDSLNGEDDFWK